MAQEDAKFKIGELLAALSPVRETLEAAGLPVPHRSMPYRWTAGDKISTRWLANLLLAGLKSRKITQIEQVQAILDDPGQRPF